MLGWKKQEQEFCPRVHSFCLASWKLDLYVRNCNIVQLWVSTVIIIFLWSESRVIIATVAFGDCRCLLYHAFASVVYFINCILQKIKFSFFFFHIMQYWFLGPEAQPTLVLQPYAALVPQTKLHLELNASSPSFPDIVLSRLPLNLVNSVWWSMNLIL